MDKIKKFLRLLGKQHPRLKTQVIEAITLIEKGLLSDIDVKKLSGTTNAYRARVGTIRIIFIKTKKENIILAVERRSDTTY